MFLGETLYSHSASLPRHFTLTVLLHPDTLLSQCLSTQTLYSHSASLPRHFTLTVPLYPDTLLSQCLSTQTLHSHSELWLFGELRWRSGESARLPPMCPRFDSRTRRHMWVEFVVGSRPSSEGFSLGSPVFLPPQKSTFLNSNSIGKFEGHGFVSRRLL